MNTKDDHQPSQAKGVYRVTNWPEYNAGLIRRGDLHVWIEESVLSERAPVDPRQRGRRQRYSDPFIQMALGLKSVFRLPLRALQGFMDSVCSLLMPEVTAPNYTTLSRRAQTLNVELPVLRDPSQPIHLLVDSTGLKLFGEGEWKVRKHGWIKRRSWRKLHLGMDGKSGQVCAVLLTHRDVDDAAVLPELLEQVSEETPIEVVAGDGAYDTKAVRAAIAEREAQALIPPVEGAVHWPESLPGASQRNEAIDAIGRGGKAQWKRDIGYHERSLVENLMYRFKTLTGDRLWARHADAQDAEVAVRVGIINRMFEIARPKSVRIA
jgi:hypothetical protein